MLFELGQIFKRVLLQCFLFSKGRKKKINSFFLLQQQD